MSIDDRVERLIALQDRLRADRPRPDTMPAWFTACAVLDKDGDVDALASAVQARHAALGKAVGRHHAPSGALRWIYAGLLVKADVPVERFAAARTALREGVRGTKTGALHAGGSRAALMLCLCSPEDTPVERFFDMKRALLPPWWRANRETTDTYAAAHAARGDDPRAVARDRERAVEVFKSHRNARSHKRDAAKLCVLLGEEPRTVLHRYDTLLTAAKQDKTLRRYAIRTRLLDWAVQGLDVDDVRAIAELRERLPRSVSTTGSARAALAHLLYTSGRPGLEGGEIAAMAAVIAAQTAMMVSVIAATSVATTSTTS